MENARALSSQVELASVVEDMPVAPLSPIELAMVAGGAGTLNFD